MKQKSPDTGTGTAFKTGIPGLDDLLKDGGIVIPTDNKDGVSILITGEAGAGKSTLALLLAVRCASQGGGCVYVALEQSSYSLRHLAYSFGVEEKGWEWLDGEQEHSHPTPSKGFLYVISPRIERQEPSFEDYLEPIKQAKDHLSTGKHLEEKQPRGQIKRSEQEQRIKDMLIIDSLNMFGGIRGVGRLQFEQLKRELSAKDRILIFVGEPMDQRPEIWSLLVDMVIELGHRTPLDYLLRTIRIAKARFQNHILGLHVVKIKGISPEKSEKASDHGFFVYPSLHYHLSVAIERREDLQEEAGTQEQSMKEPLLSTGFKVLDEALGGGIRRGTMTALSSELPYSNAARGIGMAFLMEGHHNNERGLYVSLQDDPESIVELYPEGGAFAPLDKQVLAKSVRIEPFRPGFISAEEFVDIIIKVIWDEEQGDTAYKRVVFDDVTQIGLRFPLLEHAPVFLPTLMDIFKLYNMTVLFLNAQIPSYTSDFGTITTNLNNLVSTVIEIKAKAVTNQHEGHVHIRKIANKYRVPQPLALRIDREKDGHIEILEERDDMKWA